TGYGRGAGGDEVGLVEPQPCADGGFLLSRERGGLGDSLRFKAGLDLLPGAGVAVSSTPLDEHLC
ncbi:hypothetical protein, partial [Bradyrhizobium sp. 25ACV]